MHVDYWSVIRKYFTNDWGRFVYVAHVSLVTAKALKIAKGLGLGQSQLRFIEEAAMLHDIGIVKVKAHDIGCNGELAYICHGVEGRKILESEGLHEHALVAERHTGVGISVTQIVESNLPLPQRDMLAVSLEEKIISWADLFYSKTPSRLLHEKTIEEAFDNIKGYGQDSIDRFREWEKLFAPYS